MVCDGVGEQDDTSATNGRSSSIWKGLLENDGNVEAKTDSDPSSKGKCRRLLRYLSSDGAAQLMRPLSKLRLSSPPAGSYPVLPVSMRDGR